MDLCYFDCFMWKGQNKFNLNKLQQAGGRGAEKMGGRGGRTGSGPNNASLTVSLVAPIIAFILAGIVGYALKRINLARTLYVDVSYRLRFETSAIYRLMPQLEKLRDWAGNETHETPPFIIIVKEDHFVLSNIQDDLKSCLWGNEVDAVRIFYRDFQRIEHRAGKIEELYTDLVKKYVECPSSTFRTRYARCYVDQIDDQFEIIKEIVAFWLNILCYPACDPKFEFSESLYYKIVKEIGLLNKNSRFTKAATYLIYSCRIWYPTFIVLPFIAITLVFGVVFFGVFDTWLGRTQVNCDALLRNPGCHFCHACDIFCFGMLFDKMRQLQD